MVHTIKNLLFSRLRCTPSTPSKGECFCLFPFCFLSDSRENQPDKSLISVIDNVCYVYPLARARIMRENGALTITNLILTITNLILNLALTITNLIPLYANYLCL